MLRWQANSCDDETQTDRRPAIYGTKTRDFAPDRKPFQTPSS